LKEVGYVGHLKGKWIVKSNKNKLLGICEMRQGARRRKNCCSGLCPVSVDASADGLNSGKNGGRICWAISGTFCREKIQGFYARKLLSCNSCNFYKLVRKEEGIENLFC